VITEIDDDDGDDDIAIPQQQSLRQCASMLRLYEY